MNEFNENEIRMSELIAQYSFEEKLFGWLIEFLENKILSSN